MRARPRDIQLLRRLRKYPNLATMERDSTIHVRGGVVYGDKKKAADHYIGKRLFDASMFPTDDILSFDPDFLPTAKNLRVHSRDSTSTEAFKWPQLLVKRSWHRPTGRFHSRLNASKTHAGVLCNQSYFSIHGPLHLLETAAMTHNSSVAVYFHFLTSGRFAAYRPKLSKDDVLSLPLPLPLPTEGPTSSATDLAGLDAQVYELFALKDAERVLIEDSLQYTMADFLDGAASQGGNRTNTNGSETHIKLYCTYFIRVLKAGFGGDRPISATIYQSTESMTPYRMVAFTLDSEVRQEVVIRDITTFALLDELHRLTAGPFSGTNRISIRRIMRIYQVNSGVPTVYMVKPDQLRYWTRSAGLQDADEVALDLFRWRQTATSEAHTDVAGV